MTSEGRIVSNGDYPNISEFIRVEVSAGVKDVTIDKTLIPFGFNSMISPIPDVSTANMPPVTYVTSQNTNGIFNNRTYFGFDF
ncbi:hypothetical protein IU462_31470, partial [Nocardia farcinica]|uniref:hypothetical protein n=1 Tax=Nocardia farcinica TaxID=37329 RepID=UPI00189537EC